MLYAGAQTHIAGMVRGHDRTRFEPYILCLQEKGPLGEDLAGEGITVMEYSLKRLYAWQAARSYPRYVSFLKRKKIDIVNAHLFAAQMYGIPGARMASVPLVVAGRHGAGAYWTEPRYLRVRKVTNALSHVQIAVSRAVKDFVAAEGVSPAKIRVVYNGIDTERFSPAAKPADTDGRGGFTVGYVGNLTRIKQVDVLLRAVARLAPAFPGLRVKIVGKGPGTGLAEKEGRTDQYLKSLTSELGLADRVTFMAPRREIEEQMRSMDAFVLPSASEGMSNAILEAMAVGLPVIAGDVGGNPEAIRHGRTGYLFPSRDDGTLADLLRELIRNDAMRLAMGRAARERVVELFTERRMVEEMERVYVEELGKRRR